MPFGKLVKIGVWEHGGFIGAIIFGRGANYRIGSPYGLSQDQVCECIRVAMRSHHTPVSRILSLAIALLKKGNPGLRLCISYADDGQGHLGIIYQASNWVFVGTAEQDEIRIFGQIRHKRSISAEYGTTAIDVLRTFDADACWVKMAVKYKYLYPLDRGMRRRIMPLAMPYPKRDGN